MRAISSALQEKLDAAASTFCACWRVARRDGVVQGFTDHDLDIDFGGVTYRAGEALTPTQIENAVGLGAGTGEAEGALQSDGVTALDLQNGAYDGATVEIWLVDWAAPDDRLLLDIATIGEVRRGEFAFSAELRSGAHYFDQQRGRVYQRNCAADLGDARCGFNVSTPGFFTQGQIVSATRETLTATLFDSFEADFFTLGTMTFTSGANSGARFSVKTHRQDSAQATLLLGSPPAAGVAAGDAFTLVAGCDKSPESCQNKFANIVNFRGFPHMPGNDRVIAYPSALAPAMDGGSFFK
jgi:uncharacterized phage protein (TIGR02218 family)